MARRTEAMGMSRGNDKLGSTRGNTTNRKMNVSPEEWNRMVAEAAYYIAESRHFQGGDPNQDWIEAEKQIQRRYC